MQNIPCNVDIYTKNIDIKEERIEITKENERKTSSDYSLMQWWISMRLSGSQQQKGGNQQPHQVQQEVCQVV